MQIRNVRHTTYKNRLLEWAGVGLIGLASASHAQPIEQLPESEADSAGDIVVTALRIKESVETDIAPELELDSEAVASYGASNLADLLAQISTQTRTGRGRDGGAPVVLVNGRRVSDFSEIRDFPPEALLRVETFPEEVALKYGYSADQRVVNFILKPEFAAYTGEIEYGGPMSGARGDGQFQATILKIGKTGRTNLSAQYNRASAIFESERDIVQSAPGLAENRTLLPSTEQLQLNSVANRSLGDTIGATLNLKFDQTESTSAFGLSTPASGDPLRLGQDVLTHSASAGLTVDGNIGKWRWTGTGTLGLETSRTRTDQTISPAPTRDTAFSRQFTANTALSVSGPVADLPAGTVTASLRAGFERRGFRSTSTRGGTAQQARLGRNDNTTRASIDIPLASRARSVAQPLGDLSINVNAGYRYLDDFGRLTSYGTGLNWSPARNFQFTASLAAAQGAPSQQQLSNPVVVTPGITVYDYARGASALVTIIGGGNPFLRTEKTRDLKVEASYDISKLDGLSLRTTYYRNRSANPLSGFPELTSDIERAFPGRVVRDANGQLLSIDRRAINYLATSSDETSWEINFTKQVGDVRGRQGFGAGGNARPGGGGRGGSGRLGGAGKRIQFSLKHTIKLSDQIRIAQGIPSLDLLNGSATGAFGGTPEQQVDFEGGWYNNGLGMRINANWQSGTSVNGNPLATGAAATPLRFSPLATINVRLFINFDQRKRLVNDVPFLKGSRLRLRINNITNSVRSVRDGTGMSPLRYQPGYLDPLGRTIELSFRKLF